MDPPTDSDLDPVLPSTQDVWRDPSGLPLPGQTVEIHLHTGEVRLAQWNAGHRAWSSGPRKVRTDEVSGWRPVPRLR